MGRFAVRLLMIGAGVLALAGCQAIQDKLTPTEPTPTKTTLPPLAIPVILPKASPTPTPKPSPTPSDPAPTPTPPAPPVGGSCSLPPSNSPDAPCVPGSNSFLADVDKAITQVTQQQPGIFDFDDKKCDNCYYVKNPGKFTTGVIANLNAMGLCAYYDGEELAVKNTNAFNDQYDILVASGHIRRGSGSYRVTCHPSWF
jgi:hypothetical protein